MDNNYQRIIGCGFCMGKPIIGGCPKCFRGRENKINDENINRFLTFLKVENFSPVLFVSNDKTYVQGNTREVVVLLGALFYKIRTLLGDLENFRPFADNVKYILDVILENSADLQESALTDELKKQQKKDPPSTPNQD